jgi:hypothetical protein
MCRFLVYPRYVACEWAGKAGRRMLYKETHDYKIIEVSKAGHKVPYRPT